MKENKSWLKFKRSGKISDYLDFINSCKGSETIGRSSDPLYNRSTCDKGNECGRERPIGDTFQQGTRYY